MRRFESLVLAVFLTLIILSGHSGCSKVDENKGLNVKPTVRVTGTVLVDGAVPETPIVVKAFPVSDAAAEQAPSNGGTNDKGVFELTTYKQGDGIPAGEYKLTFVWTEMRMGGSALNSGKMDKLGGQYASPKTTPFTVTIEESTDVVEIGPFDLKKSASPKKLWDDRSKNPEPETKNVGGGRKKKRDKD